MLRNNKFALLGHIGICLIVLYVGGFSPNIFKQFFVGIAVMILYFVFGSLLTNQNSSFKNLLSVSVISLAGFLLTIYSIVIYQLDVVNTFNYSHETLHYKIVWYISSNFNASAVPAANFIGRFLASFKVPYGLGLTFIIPSLMMWVGLEWKRKKGNSEEIKI